jgi:hypothetical protein
MAEYVIPNYTVTGRLLRYDPAHGTTTEVEEQGDEDVCQGEYVDPGRDLGGYTPQGPRPATGVFAGYFETEEGPVFFRNAERWPLSQDRSRAEVRRGPAGYTFVLWEGDERRVSIDYPGPLPDNLFFPVDEALRDPFQWLAQSLPASWFHECRLTQTLDEARRAVAGAAGPAGPPGPARLLERLPQAGALESTTLRKALFVLLEQGRPEEQELAAAVFLQHPPGMSLLRRLARTYAARGWDGGHPSVTLFVKYGPWLGRRARAVLQRRLREDPARHAALRDVRDPDDDPAPEA